MRYELKHMDTVAGVGCFAAMPGPNLSLNQVLDHIREAPFDDFMHQFALQQLGNLRTRKVEQYIAAVTDNTGDMDRVLAALLLEACLNHQRFFHLRPRLDGLDHEMLACNSPALYLRSHLQPDQPLHAAWAKLFAAAAMDHTPLPAPEQSGLQLPYTTEEMQRPPQPTATHIRAELAEGLPPARERMPALETALHALKLLDKAGAFATPEMQHKACLSPFARLRHWMFKVSTKNGRHDHTFEGMQTSYGRGLDENAARASYAMEVAERFSSYVSVGQKGVTGLAGNGELVRADLNSARKQMAALNLEKLRLEVPYQRQTLHWLTGERMTEGGAEPVLIPLQLVSLFCNLDEQTLFSALGSTGLASGNTMAEARLSALCEVLERDADAVQPLDMRHCFRVQTSEPILAKHLAALEECGIHVWFQDMTQEFGVPCYKSMVLGIRGDVNQGTGCSLNGARALISALTETPYPFPGPASGQTPEGLPVRRLEDLPDLSTGSAEGDLLILEKTLLAGGYTPHYADLTRRDLQIPVCRAIVPGLEIVSDYDRFTRLSPRLFRNYLRLFS
ncbi:MAG: YcaO-like family protein [Desulfovibrionaceae bacterium]